MPQVCWKILILTVVALIVSGHRDGLRAQQGANGDDSAPSLQTPPEESPLLVEPKTPEESFEATVLMVRLASPGLARQYLQQFMDANPDDDTLLALRDKHGPAIFLKLATMNELKPLSTQLLNRVNTAFRRRDEDPRRIDQLISQLSGTPQERDVALVALKSTGTSAIPRMLKHLGNADRVEEHDAIVYALVAMGDVAVAPMLGALESPNDVLRSSVLTVLGYLGTREIVPHLWKPAFSPEEIPSIRLSARRALARILHASPERVDQVSPFGAAQELRDQARQHFNRTYPWKAEEDGNVEVWTWSPQQETIVSHRLSPAAASNYRAARLARQALALSPENEESQSLYIATTLGFAAEAAGWDSGLPTGPGTPHDVALSAGADVVGDALSLALEGHNSAAAIAALQVLGQNGSRQQLHGHQARTSPITVALNYPDQRVQFAAATAILQLDPIESFTGAPRVMSVLARSLQDTGNPGVVVVHGDPQQARTLAGTMGELGYEARVALSGRDGFRIASTRNDIELVILHLNVIRWPLSQTIANFRADARTAGLPIVIYGPEQLRGEATSLMRKYPLVTYVGESSTAANLDVQLQPFLSGLRTPPMSPQQRQAMQSEALYWLAHIASGRRTGIYDLREVQDILLDLANDPDLAPNALLTLSAVPTPEAQRHLHEIAVNAQRDAAIREAAALQLAYHIQRYGLLLSTGEVNQIELAWKASQSPELTTALSSIMGLLQPDGKRVSERLRQLPPPGAPLP